MEVASPTRSPPPGQDAACAIVLQTRRRSCDWSRSAVLFRLVLELLDQSACRAHEQEPEGLGAAMASRHPGGETAETRRGRRLECR